MRRGVSLECPEGGLFICDGYQCYPLGGFWGSASGASEHNCCRNKTLYWDLLLVLKGDTALTERVSGGVSGPWSELVLFMPKGPLAGVGKGLGILTGFGDIF